MSTRRVVENGSVHSSALSGALVPDLTSRELSPRWWQPLTAGRALLELAAYVAFAGVSLELLVVSGAPRFLLIFWTLPVLLVGPRWPLAVLMAGVVSIFAIGVLGAARSGADLYQEIVRLSLHTSFLGVVCLLLHSAGRRLLAERADLAARKRRLQAALESDISAARETEARVTAQRQELQAVLDAIPALVYYKDDANTILGLNRHAAEAIGLPQEQIVGRPTEDFFPAADAAAYLADDREVLRSGRPKLGILEEHSPEGGGRQTIRTDKIPLRSGSEEFDRLVAVATDITDVVAAQSALAEAQQRLSLAVRGSQDGIWDWNMQTGELYVAPRWRELLGLPADLPIGDIDQWSAFVASTSLPAFRKALEDHLGGLRDTVDVEVEMLHADGQPRWMRCRAEALRDSSGKAVRLAGSISDISELKSIQHELRMLAEYDHLTGLANRKRLLDRIQHSLSRGRRNPEYSFALLFLDFDRFKVVNDGLGHSVGDALLVSIARRLETAVRDTDLVARFGGDEFVVLLDDVDPSAALHGTCTRLLDILAMPHLLGQQEIYATASIGVVSSTQPESRSAEGLLRDADAAMYVAKSEGKATYRIFDEAMHAAALDAVFVEQALRSEPFDREFELHYQPIIELSTGRVVGLEALARWRHPELGMIQPDRFIPVAEETGLIVPLGRWVLVEALRQIAMWRRELDGGEALFVNVNVSKRELLAPGLMEAIRSAIAGNGLDASALKLEITETAIMTHSKELVPVLRALAEAGFGLAMDDFGTGHSSLSALYNFPISELKLDRSFIANLQADGAIGPVVAPVVSLASNLRMTVVAEGVETDTQVGELLAVGCHYGQGYHFARPMPALEVGPFLRKRLLRRERGHPKAVS